MPKQLHFLQLSLQQVITVSIRCVVVRLELRGPPRPDPARTCRPHVLQRVRAHGGVVAAEEEAADPAAEEQQAQELLAAAALVQRVALGRDDEDEEDVTDLRNERFYEVGG